MDILLRIWSFMVTCVLERPPGVLLAQHEIMFLKQDQATLVKVIMALVGLVILGVAMIALVWLGARVTRRYFASLNDPPKDTAAEDHWYKKPLVPDD